MSEPAIQPQLRERPKDPFSVKEFTLSNGMRLFVSVNKHEPRIYTQIAVRAGSKQDPPETTGLAHYMEHMLFKGTSRIGTRDWKREKELLDQIEDLFEKYRQSKEESERKAIYRQIDKLSFEAAKLVAPNEYDKLATSIGAKSTNAYTWVEQTVFLNDIPSNELERWMKLETERFRMLALRLFHTELETVYEEFNISQDRDFRKVNKAIREVLFPSHPYGTQTTIGSAQDLKSPSMRNIQWFFKTYYVPNNMALILTGDLDPEEAFQLAETYFGTYPAREIPPFTFEEQPPLARPVEKEVFGQEAPFVQIAWRSDGSQSDNPFLLSVLNTMLYNQRAGLLDENLLQNQKVLEARSWSWLYEDYSVFGLYGKAREGQALEEVKDLLLEQVEKIRNGDFEPWLLEGAIRDLRINELRATEDNEMRAHILTNAFILGIDWERYVHRFELLDQLSPERIASIARDNLNEDYVAVYKRQGPDDQVVKVDKPEITPVQLDRDALSEFGKAFLAQSAPTLPPVFMDADKDIQTADLQGTKLSRVRNPDNSIFSLSYLYDWGSSSDPWLRMALRLLPYLGTSDSSVKERQRDFFKLGLRLNTGLSEKRFRISLSGLEENLPEGIRKLDHFLAQLRGEPESLRNLVADVLIKRRNAKQNKQTILQHGMLNYARYGAISPFTDKLSEEQLLQLDANELASHLTRIGKQEHQVYYYGQMEMEEVEKCIAENHALPNTEGTSDQIKTYPETETRDGQVYFVHFPMVQVEIMLYSRGTPHFSLEEHLLSQLYNEYFGYGLSSIVFQEIRESRALAYSTYAYYSTPLRADKAHRLRAFVGTQPDKMQEAITSLRQILEEMPVVPDLIDQARLSIQKRIATERVKPDSLFWEMRRNRDRGFNRDLRQDMYDRMASVRPQELVDFQQQHVKGRPYTLLVLGDRDRIDFDFLNQQGKVEELNLEQIFGY
jgi:predicted Zn-dependent peptidase